jgi:enoyl-CoA hydratase
MIAWPRALAAPGTALARRCYAALMNSSSSSSSSSNDLVQVSLRDDVAVITMDDGKANALSTAMLESLDDAFAAAERDAKAIVLSGRPGRFCAGFDLSVMGQGGDAMRELVGAGAELCLRLLEYPKPIVVACTGHALAAGILLVTVCDFRIGARGPFKLGLNEVAIGLPLPHFAREIARERVSKRHLDRAAVHAEIYDPEGAVDAGYLDVLADAEALETVAGEHAVRLSRLDARAFAHTKRALHADAVSRIRDGLARERGSAPDPA